MLIVDDLTHVHVNLIWNPEYLGRHTIGFQDMNRQDTYIVHVHHGLQDISSQDTAALLCRCLQFWLS